MKQILTAVLLLAFYCNAFSQCEDGRYHDIIFPSASVESDILYGNNIDFQGTDTDLYLDVYTPDGDDENLRPLVIFAHGGSFVAGSKDGLDVVPLCNDFSRMGYVTASIQYRLGIPITFLLEEPATEAVVRGFHDMKAAIRFFRKSVEEDGNPYGIDTDKIYLAGVSAGGFITLHNAYMNQESELPTIVDYSQAGLTGGIEGDSGNDGFSSEFNGVVNICGALSDTTIMEAGDLPLLSFHGPNDGTVPYGSDTQTLAGFPVVEVDGSESIHIKADELGLTNCFEIYEDQDHVPHVSSVAYYDTTRAIMSNFLAHLVCPDFDLDCSYTELFIVNIEDEVKNESFMVFPNPSSGNVNMILPETSESSLVAVLDQSGREVFRSQVKPNQVSMQLELNGFSAGIYFISWTDGSLIRTERLVLTN